MMRTKRYAAIGATIASLAFAVPASAETHTMNARPGQTVTWVTHGRYAQGTDWALRIGASPDVFAESASPTVAWVYGEGVVVRVSQPNGGRWTFRATNTASRPRAIRVRLHESERPAKA